MGDKGLSVRVLMVRGKLVSWMCRCCRMKLLATCSCRMTVPYWLSVLLVYEKAHDLLYMHFD